VETGVSWLVSRAGSPWCCVQRRVSRSRPGRNRYGVQRGGSLEPPGPLPMHLHTMYMEYSECLPTLLTPLAERTFFSQVSTHPVAMWVIRSYLQVRLPVTYVALVFPGASRKNEKILPEVCDRPEGNFFYLQVDYKLAHSPGFAILPAGQTGNGGGWHSDYPYHGALLMGQFCVTFRCFSFVTLWAHPR
jgi:hypothetical protein